MIPAPLHQNEEGRIAALRESGILQNKCDPRLEEITLEASERLSVPMSTVSVIDKDTEIYVGRCGIAQTSGPRDISFCGHALAGSELLFVCENTLKDPRFTDNPYVVGPPFIRFYAGMKLFKRADFLPIAVFCIKDTKPRSLSEQCISVFMELSQRAEDLLNES